MPFDADLGMTLKRHPVGYWVGAVKREPGVYWKEDGREATLEEAEAAGFDVSREILERRKRKILASARERIERETAEQLDAIDREATAYVADKYVGAKRLEAADLAAQSPAGLGAVRVLDRSYSPSAAGVFSPEAAPSAADAPLPAEADTDAFARGEPPADGVEADEDDRDRDAVDYYVAEPEAGTAPKRRRGRQYPKAAVGSAPAAG